ncbi:MAG: 3-hydroxybutyrate dehydrogenase [Chitinophagales bacterium]|nr:3-hydroxybutyrate dehydrogenase [Chitinophagales bacterium]
MKNKVAVITGSTSGIGLGIAQTLAKEGVHLVINGLAKPSVVETILADLMQHNNIQVVYHNANMTEPLAIEALIQFAISNFGNIDYLINNAGVQFVSSVEDFPNEKWNEIIAVNLNSAFYTSKYAIPFMKKNKFGRIINIASAHGLVASPFKSAYVAAKHGLVGFTKTIALELAEYGITANTICPGYVMTPLVKNQIADTANARNLTEEAVINDVLLAAQPTKQFVKIEQIAALVKYLCSEDACQITGTQLSIDGGWTAH